MIRILLSVLFGMATFLNCNAEKVSIKGNAASYAGSKIEIFSHTDSFIYQHKKLAEFTVDNQGNFSIELDIENTQLVFFPLGIYKGFIYLEPGRNYEIKLPPKTDLTPAQKLNPFFEADELMLGVANAGQNELNLLIRKLDDQIDSFVNQNFRKIYRKKEQSVGWEFTEQLKKQFVSISNPFFKDYFHYRLGFLEFLAFPNSFATIEEKYFKDRPILLENPAYMSLFKKEYGNFLNSYFSQKEGLAVSKAYQSNHPFLEISKLLQKYPAYQNEQFRNLIIASSIFDSYTRKFIGKSKTLQILNSLKDRDSHNYNQNLCRGYIAKITHLQKNYPAPDFNIDDVHLSNYRGKYLYLNFCNTQSYPCLQDFKQMEKLRKQFGKQVEFLSISCDWEKSKLETFLQQNHFSWDFVHIGNQYQLIHDYKVKAFPSYALIDPKGNIVKAPAPGPRENIQLEFIKIARDAARKEYQK